MDSAYFAALAANKDMGATRGIDATLYHFGLDALLLPTDAYFPPAAMAGYPVITGTCPMLPLVLVLPPQTVPDTPPHYQYRSDSCLMAQNCLRRIPHARPAATPRHRQSCDLLAVGAGMTRCVIVGV